MGANHVLSGERPAISNASDTALPVQPNLSCFQIQGTLRSHFETDVTLTRVVDHLEAEIIIRPHFEV